MVKCRLCGDSVIIAETASGKTVSLDIQVVRGFKLSMDTRGKQYADVTRAYRPHVCK